MVTYQQSLQLSVQTYWRYLIVMVLFSVGLVFIIRKIPASYLVYVFLSLPLLVILIVVALVAVLLASVLGIMMFSGICAALRARGHTINLSAAHILRCAGVLFMITFVAYFVFTIIAGLIFWISQSVGGPADSFALRRGVDAGALSAHVVLFLILVPVAAYLSAIVVSLTAMLNGDQMFGHEQPVFFLLGKGLVSLLPIMQVILYSGVLATTIGNVGPFFAVGPVQMLLFLVLTWAGSWFFSHAVLIWEASIAQWENALLDAGERYQATRVNPRTLRQLRESRNPDIA